MTTELSKRSRAARRATEIDIDTDKSLKNVKPPTESDNYRPAVLQAHHGAGITKKGKQGRKSVLSSRARRRQEKGADRAEAIMDRTSTRREKSRGQSRSIQERSKNWEDVNKKAVQLRQKFPTEEEAVEESSGDEATARARGWESDEDMDAATGTSVPAVVAPAVPVVVDAPAAQTDDHDEIL
jgi:Alb1 domain-containing protein